MTGQPDTAGAFAPLARARAREASIQLLAAEIAACLAADDGFVERLADAVAERAEPPAPPAFVDAHGLADVLGITADTVRRHAAELGGVRPMGGERGRWRFDVERARELWVSRSRSERSPAEDPALQRLSRPRRRARSGSGGDLLPIRGAHKTVEEVQRAA